MANYTLDYYNYNTEIDEEENLSKPWTIQDYTLSHALKVTSNYQAEEIVSSMLERKDPDLYKEVDFDSEHGCFFAYTAKEEEILKLKSFIEGIVEAGPNPLFTRGGIELSPAYFPRS